MSTFFTSDIHWNHANICRGTSKWYSDNCRNFNSLEEMNEFLINQINKYVGQDDVLYNLGDATFGGIEAIWNLRKQLNVKTIHYVYGNHCHHYKRNRELPNCYYVSPLDRIGAGVGGIKDGPKGSYYGVYVHDLFASTQDVIFTKIENHQFFMSHYPHVSWDGSNRGVIMLHGHEHGGLNYMNEDCKRLDVGIDSAYKILGEYKPFSLEEVLQITETKPVLKLGHH